MGINYLKGIVTPSRGKEAFPKIEEAGVLDRNITLKNPTKRETRYGNIVAGKDQGFGYTDKFRNPKDEDRIFLKTNEGKACWTIIDGMGGHGNGNKAAQQLGIEISNAYQNPPSDYTNTNLQMKDRILSVVKKAHQAAIDSFIRDSDGRGACYVHSELIDDTLYTYSAGDAQTWIIHSDGTITEVNQPENSKEPGKGHIVTNAVSASHPDPEIQCNTAKLNKGDIVVSSSDGLPGNFTKEQIAKMVHNGKTISEVFSIIEQETEKRMTGNESKYSDRKGLGIRDNRALVAFEYNPATETEHQPSQNITTNANNTNLTNPEQAQATQQEIYNLRQEITKESSLTKLATEARLNPSERHKKAIKSLVANADNPYELLQIARGINPQFYPTITEDRKGTPYAVFEINQAWRLENTNQYCSNGIYQELGIKHKIEEWLPQKNGELVDPTDSESIADQTIKMIRKAQSIEEIEIIVNGMNCPDNQIIFIAKDEKDKAYTKEDFIRKVEQIKKRAYAFATGNDKTPMNYKTITRKLGLRAKIEELCGQK